MFDETAPRDNSYIERHTHVAKEGNEGADMSHSQLQRTHIPENSQSQMWNQSSSNGWILVVWDLTCLIRFDLELRSHRENMNQLAVIQPQWDQFYHRVQNYALRVSDVREIIDH